MIAFLEELLHRHFEWGAGNYKDIGNAMKFSQGRTDQSEDGSSGRKRYQREVYALSFSAEAWIYRGIINGDKGQQHRNNDYNSTFTCIGSPSNKKESRYQDAGCL